MIGFLLRRIACGALALAIAGCFSESKDVGGPATNRGSAPEEAAAPEPSPPPVPSIVWKDGPDAPSAIGDHARPRVVLLSAPWCQWCRVFEHEVLPDEQVRRNLSQFETLHIDVDASPLWLDIPGFVGLPTLAFFDAQGRHLLTRSGYRPAGETSLLLEVVRGKIDTGELDPYAPPPPPRRLSDRALSPEAARAELERFQSALFMKVNSNDGGFFSPARHPFPALLVELQRWRASGAPADIEEWITLTMRGALRGSSPRLEGEPLPDMDFDGEELRQLSKLGPDAGPRWRQGIDLLSDMDPYRGLQDPVDDGIFRYSAGPGWYHPHFERRAAENLAWAELLSRRGDRKQARRIVAFVENAFGRQGLLATSQRSDPFYYRLRAEERAGLEPPPVAEQFNLAVQASAARAAPARCAALQRVPSDRWPRSAWTVDGEDPNSADAPPDAVGELLFALAHCGREASARADALAQLVSTRWEQEGLPANARLFRLAAGICAARANTCGRALAAVEGIELSLDHPPPLAELAALARK